MGPGGLGETAGAVVAQAALPGGTATLGILAVLVLGFASLLAALVLVSRRQLRRDLHEIGRTLEDLHAGRRGRKAVVGPGSSVAYLAESVNRIADDLDARGRDGGGADERLRAVLDAARDQAFMVTDGDLDVRSFSAGAIALLGWEEEEMLGKSVATVFDEASWKEFLPKLSRRALRDRGVEGRVRAMRKDGTSFAGQAAVRPFPGVPGGLLFLVRDASAEARLEQDLRESEARYRALFEGLAEGVFLLQRGEIVLANPALARLAGTAPEAMIRKPLRDWVATRDLLVVQERLAALEAGRVNGPQELSFTLLDAEGRAAAEIGLRAAGVVLAGRPAVLGVVRDLTAERFVEAELRRNETRLDAVLEATSDGILVLADDSGGGVARMTNAAFARIFGIPEKEILGASELDLLRLLRARGGGAERVAAFLASATEGPRGERIVLEGEPPRVLEVRAAVLFGSGGESLGRVLACRDITDQKAFEERIEANAEALRRSKVELEASHARLHVVKDELAARAKEEERLNRELKALDEMKTNLLANVSHELQTPLVSVRGYTEMILRERLGSINEEQRRGLTLTLTNIDRLISMIDNLLFFTRKQEGEMELKLSVFPLRSVVEEAIALVAEKASSRGIEVVAEVEEPEVRVHADRDKILQVLLNLLTNAVKFNREGGRVDIAVRRGKPGFADTRVRDSGVGIPREDVDRIFDRYYRGSSADRSGAEGYGIGLALVRDILRSHGCGIRVESEVGKGSTFVFGLPLEDEASPRATEPEAQPTSSPESPEAPPPRDPAPDGTPLRPRFRIIRNKP